MAPSTSPVCSLLYSESLCLPAPSPDSPVFALVGGAGQSYDLTRNDQVWNVQQGVFLPLDAALQRSLRWKLVNVSGPLLPGEHMLVTPNGTLLYSPPSDNFVGSRSIIYAVLQL